MTVSDGIFFSDPPRLSSRREDAAQNKTMLTVSWVTVFSDTVKRTVKNS